MRLTVDQRWRKTLVWLRRSFPVGFPVSVRRETKIIVEGVACEGASWKYKNRGQIRLRRSQCWGLLVDALIHEWAHLATYNGHDSRVGEIHGGDWGLMYARIYRAHIEWNYGGK